MSHFRGDFFVGLKQNIFKEPETRFVNIACYGTKTPKCFHPPYLVSATFHKVVAFSLQFSLLLPTGQLSISQLIDKIGFSLSLYQNDSIHQTQNFPLKVFELGCEMGEVGVSAITKACGTQTVLYN